MQRLCPLGYLITSQLLSQGNSFDFLQHCHTAMNTIHYLNVLNDPDENQKMIRKLLTQVVLRWSQIVDEWLAASELEEGSELF